jgi:hypothetical protein
LPKETGQDTGGAESLVNFASPLPVERKIWWSTSVGNSDVSQRSDEVGNMRIGFWLSPLVLVVLGGCTPTVSATGGTEPRFLEEVPEAVRAAAAPFQDLNSVQIRPEDGCYWYRHRGPVETTFLPLRTVEGRPICTRPQTVEPAVGT